jgi:ATP adenylyltransferase
MGHCPLCVAIAGGAAIVEGETSVALLDKYPLSPGHCLILPRRHVPLFWDLSRSELAALFDLVSEAKAVVDERFQPGGYNIGVNVGEVAGQTIQHVHIHLIPRYAGDDPDPRGGVRWILPERALLGVNSDPDP